MRAVITGCMALALGACAHSFETAKFDTKTWELKVESDKTKARRIEGVVYYEPHFVLLQTAFTALVVDGFYVGNEDSPKDSKTELKCRRTIEKEEISIKPNFSDPHVIINKPSNFSNGKLSVTLQDGMLKTLNSENDTKAPDLIKEVRETAKVGFDVLMNSKRVATQIAAVASPNIQPACNAAPVVTYFGPFPKPKPDAEADAKAEVEAAPRN